MGATRKLKQFGTFISVTVDCLQFLLWGEDRNKFIYGTRNMRL